MGLINSPFNPDTAAADLTWEQQKFQRGLVIEDMAGMPPQDIIDLFDPDDVLDVIIGALIASKMELDETDELYELIRHTNLAGPFKRIGGALDEYILDKVRDME